jgi:hypothetical protein
LMRLLFFQSLKNVTQVEILDPLYEALTTNQTVFRSQ